MLNNPIIIAMKSILTFIIALVFVATAGGQDLKQQVVSSAGGFGVSGDNSISLSWTLGELVISTVQASGGDLILTQGFQQSKLTITAIDVNKDLGVEVSVYPNPTSELVNIKFGAPLEGETTLFLMAPDGRQVLNMKLEQGEVLKEIDMNEFPGGTYFLRIQNGIKLNVYKIVKL